MKRTVIALLMIFLASLGAMGIRTSGPANIFVSMSGFHDEKGWALAALFRSSKGFPSDFSYAFMTATAEINGGQSSIVFAGVPLGEYAVSVVHDADMDGNFDRNWIFLPAEGWGTSNNVKGVFGPGDYSGAKFILDSPQASLFVPINY